MNRGLRTVILLAMRLLAVLVLLVSFRASLLFAESDEEWTLGIAVQASCLGEILPCT